MDNKVVKGKGKYPYWPKGKRKGQSVHIDQKKKRKGKCPYSSRAPWLIVRLRKGSKLTWQWNLKNEKRKPKIKRIGYESMDRFIRWEWETQKYITLVILKILSSTWSC